MAWEPPISNDTAIFWRDSTNPRAFYNIFTDWTSPSKTNSLLFASAMFILIYISPSECKIFDLFIISLYAYNSMLLFIDSGGLISLIS